MKGASRELKVYPSRLSSKESSDLEGTGKDKREQGQQDAHTLANIQNSNITKRIDNTKYQRMTRIKNAKDVSHLF